MDENKNLIILENPVKEMNYKTPVASPDTHKSHITRIKNAYNATAYLDNSGIIWIESSKLSEIIRTNVANAKYIVSNNIPDDAKGYRDKKTYVIGSEIKKLLEKSIEEEGIGKKKQYLKYSEQLFNAIRDCDRAENIRNKYQSQIQDSRKTLKKKRIKQYNIIFDSNFAA